MSQYLPYLLATASYLSRLSFWQWAGLGICLAVCYHSLADFGRGFLRGWRRSRREAALRAVRPGDWVLYTPVTGNKLPHSAVVHALHAGHVVEVLFFSADGPPHVYRTAAVPYDATGTPGTWQLRA